MGSMNKEIQQEVAGAIMEAIPTDKAEKERLEKLGNSMFKLYTEHGLPPDMFLERVELDKKQQLYVVFIYQGLTIQHKRKANIGEARLAKAQANNTDLIHQFLKTGEMGIY